MLRSILGTVFACMLGVAALAFGPYAAWAEKIDAIAGLGGRWAGMGTIVPASGPSEDFKCVITYFPSEDGTRVRQNLRCQGVNHRFDAATHLQIDGSEITGRWKENIHSLTGTVSGAVTQEGFIIQLSGDFFEAKMTVVSSRCEQSVTVIPDRATQMKELAARLRKC
jgi:hypothetical protein